MISYQQNFVYYSRVHPSVRQIYTPPMRPDAVIATAAAAKHHRQVACSTSLSHTEVNTIIQ